MKSFKVGLLGFGGVGRAFLELCSEKSAELREKYGVRMMLCGVCDHSGFAINAYGLDWRELFDAKRGGMKLADRDDGMAAGAESAAWRYASAGVNLIVDVLPSNLIDGEPGLTVAQQALAQNMHFVTADKGPVVLALRRLLDLAERNEVGFGYSATVAAALPTASFARDELLGARITGIRAILSGTCNFVLTQMASGIEYADAIKQAQELGIAEPVPAADITGMDSAAKLLVIANSAFGTSLQLSDIVTQGIEGIKQDRVLSAAGASKRIRLVARALNEDGRVTLQVGPEEIGPEDPLYSVEGTNKAVEFETDTMGKLFISGGASSKRGAAAAILKDVLRIARDRME